MFRKILTHLIIFTLTVLPVQVISADVENSNMKMTMQKNVQTEHECMHGSTKDSQQSTGVAACCDDSSHQCDNCPNCTQAVSASFLMISNYSKNTLPLITPKYFISHLLLNGVTQQNLLRPPRSFI